MIRVAAIGDVHVGLDDAGSIAPALASLRDEADVLLVAGDLTRHGDPAEARVLARELASAPVPVLAVLGNHDHHLDQQARVADELTAVGVRVLEGEVAELDLPGGRLAVFGAKGFGGGFEGACGSEFGEREMKAFIRHTRHVGERLEQLALEVDDASHRVVLLHYAPCRGTCVGEQPEIFPFLGSYLLGEAVDRMRADLALHGHAHHGSEHGQTAGGVPVRNVARPLVGVAYRLFELTSPREAVLAGSSPVEA
jgi:Icc-related predicted phosphoesterase